MAFGDLKVQDLIYEDGSNNEITVVLANLVVRDGSGNLVQADNKKFIAGTGSDLQIYHDGNHSRIADTGTGKLYFTTSAALFGNAAANESLAEFTENGSCSLRYDNSKKFETTSTGATISGNLIASSSGNATVTTTRSGGAEMNIHSQSIRGIVGTVSNHPLRLMANNSQWIELGTSGYLDLFGDNQILRIGASQDLQIWHNGTNSHIRNNTGDLILDCNSSGVSSRLRPKLGEEGVVTTADGLTALYYDGSKKLQTTANGVWTNGNHYFNDNQKIELGNNGDFQIYHNGSASIIVDTNADSDLYIMTDRGGFLNQAGNEWVVKYEQNSFVQLFYDNSKKFETSSTGTTTTGVSSTTSLSINNTSGYIGLPDNAKIFVGTGNDLQIYHDGSHSCIKHDGAGSLLIMADTGQIEISKTNNYEKMIVGIPDGAAELYYDGSKKLVTTSTGVNVTGALTVNGAALSSAPTITGTASGSIANNAAVIAKSDGTLEAVSGVSAGLSSYNNFITDSSTSTAKHIGTTKLSGGQVAVLYRDDANSDRSRVIIGTISGSGASSSITWNSPSSTGAIAGQSASGNGNPHRICSLSNNRFVVGYRYGDNPYVRIGTVSGTGSSASISWGSQYRFDDNYSADGFDIDSNGNDKILMVGIRSTNDNLRTRWADCGTSGNTITRKNGENQGGNKDNNWCRVKYDPDADRFIAVFEQSNNVGVMSFELESGGNVGASTEYFTGINGAGQDSSNYPCMAYDTTNDKMLLLIPTNSSNTQAVCLTTNSSNGAISIGSTKPLFGGATKGLSVSYDSGNKFMCAYRDGSTGGYQRREITISGTTPSVGTETAVWAQTGGEYPDQYMGDTVTSISSKLWLFTFSLDISGSRGRAIFLQEPDSNLTEENFVGFSSAAYSNGNTATINVVGNTTTKSSLTPGQKYYVQGDGSVGLTADSSATQVAGLALTSTKLLIKG